MIFSFLDRFSRYNQIHIRLEDQDKTTFTCPSGTFSYRILHFILCNAPAISKGVVLSIFAELVHDTIEIYMDDFTRYECDFEEALSNLGNVLKKCIEMSLSLIPKKCELFMTAWTSQVHSIS